MAPVHIRVYDGNSQTEVYVLVSTAAAAWAVGIESGLAGMFIVLVHGVVVTLHDEITFGYALMSLNPVTFSSLLTLLSKDCDDDVPPLASYTYRTWPSESRGSGVLATTWINRGTDVLDTHKPTLRRLEDPTRPLHSEHALPSAQNRRPHGQDRILTETARDKETRDNIVRHEAGGEMEKKKYKLIITCKFN